MNLACDRQGLIVVDARCRSAVLRSSLGMSGRPPFGTAPPDRLLEGKSNAYRPNRRHRCCGDSGLLPAARGRRCEARSWQPRSDHRSWRHPGIDPQQPCRPPRRAGPGFSAAGTKAEGRRRRLRGADLSRCALLCERARRPVAFAHHLGRGSARFLFRRPRNRADWPPWYARRDADATLRPTRPDQGYRTG